MKREQRASGERLHQEVVENYRKVRKRNGVFSLILIVVLLVSGFGLFNLFTSNGYGDKKVSYDQQLTKLNQEREDILSGKKVTVNKSFKTALNDNLANLKEYPKKANNYDVAIEETDGHLTINKNNIFVSDNANMLSQKMKEKIYQLNKQLAASTNGAQLEVVTIPELPRGEDIESYANKIFNQLGIGDRNEDNGVLYLIALDEREFRLEVGYGLEGLIPDGKADDIINNDDVVDAFKDEDYDTGVSQVVDEVFGIMNTKTALVDSQIKNVESQRTKLMFFHWLIGMSVKGVNRAIVQGRLLRNPSAEKKMFGRILIGDTLYSGNGDILTTAYLASNYNSDNWSDNNNSGSGGGSSWGSFGGGSSGGGGASGGW